MNSDKIKQLRDRFLEISGHLNEIKRIYNDIYNDALSLDNKYELTENKTLSEHLSNISVKVFLLENSIDNVISHLRQKYQKTVFEERNIEAPKRRGL